jgi:hypothetical protein
MLSAAWAGVAGISKENASMKTAKTAPTRATNPRTASALFRAPTSADSPTASAFTRTFAAHVWTLETTVFMA